MPWFFNLSTKSTEINVDFSTKTRASQQLSLYYICCTYLSLNMGIIIDIDLFDHFAYHPEKGLGDKVEHGNRKNHFFT